MCVGHQSKSTEQRVDVGDCRRIVDVVVAMTEEMTMYYGINQFLQSINNQSPDVLWILV